MTPDNLSRIRALLAYSKRQDMRHSGAVLQGIGDINQGDKT